MEFDMSELEFRTDDIEKAQIRERNISLAKSIVSKVGIGTDNPNYKDFLVQTIENVHNVFRFSSYNDDSEDMIVNILKTNVENIETYKRESFSYKKFLVEQQVRNASGSTFGSGSSYERLYQIIRETIQSGMEMRKEFGTEFPDIFYDEEGNLRERLIIEIPYEMQESSAMGMIANYARTHSGVSFDRDENRFIVNGKPVGPEKFFRNKAEKLEKFVKQLEADNSVLDLADEELMKVILEGDYEEFTQLRAKRGKEGDKKNVAIRNALADAQIFEDVQERLSLHVRGNVDSFMHYLREAMADYDTKANLVRREAEKDTIENIDRIMLTINPYDVATQSTFRDWNSCMHAVGCNHRYVDDSIGVGSIVAYGYDSSNPSKMVSRLLIHPFTNEKGEAAYSINPRIYGHENMAFRKVVESIVASKLNKGKDGIFRFNREKVSDEKGYLYDDGGVKTIYCFRPDERGCVDFRKNNEKSFDLARTDISDIRKFIFAEDTRVTNIAVKENAEVEFDNRLTLYNVSLGKGVKFNGEGDIHLSNVESIGEGVKISQPVYLSGNIADDVDLRGIENLIIKGNVTFGKGVKLPENFKYESNCVISGNIPEQIDLTGVKNITIKNAHLGENNKIISSEDTKISLSGVSIGKGDVFEGGGSIYISELNDIEEGVKISQPVYLSGNIADNADLSGIENLIIQGDVTFGTGVKLPENVKYESNCVISGNIPEQMDLTGVKRITIKNAHLGENNKIISSEDTKISLSGVSIGKGVVFEGDGRIDISRLKDMEEGVKISQPVYLLGNIADNADLSGIENLIIQGDVTFGKGVKLPENLAIDSMDTFTIKDNIPRGMDLSNVKSLRLKNVGSVDGSIKFPKHIEIEEKIPLNMDLLAFESMELKSIADISSGTKLPKELVLKGFIRSGDLSGVEKLTLVDIEALNGVVFPKNVLVTGAVGFHSYFENIENVEYFGNVNFDDEFRNHPKHFKFADDVVVSGCLLSNFDFSDRENLTVQSLKKVEPGVKFPKKLEIKSTNYNIKSADFTDVEELTIKRGNFEGEDVKFAGHVKISSAEIDGCDFSKVDVLEIGERVSIKGDIKLPEELTIKGNRTKYFDFSKLKKLVIETDVYDENATLPEEAIIKATSISNSLSIKGKNLTIEGAKSVCCDLSEVDCVKLINEDNEYELGNKLSKKLILPDGAIIKKSYIYGGDFDLGENKNLTLVDSSVDEFVKLPDEIRVTGDIDHSHFTSCKCITLFGHCELGNYNHYPERIEVADDAVLSGYIPAGLDLSEVKGLVLSGKINIGEGVKLPKDVKFAKGLKVSGFIPDGTDLSNVDELTLDDKYAPVVFGKDVKLPDNCKYDNYPTVKGYIPENIDYKAVKFNNAIFTGYIPDGTDVGRNAKIIGEITLGKDVKVSWNTDCSEAIFLGDVCISESVEGGDFSKANSVQFPTGFEINKDIKLPESGDVMFGDVVVVSDEESLLKIAKYDLENTVVGMEQIEKGITLPKNVMFLFVDEEKKHFVVCPEGCEDKMKSLLENMVDTYEHLSYDELSEKFGVKVVDMAKEKEKQSTIADIKSRLAKKGVSTTPKEADDKSSTSTPKVNGSAISTDNGISI
jgi:serine acetyltransferase